MSCKEFNTKSAEIIIKDRKWKYDLESLSIAKNITGDSDANFTLTFINEEIKPIEVGTPVYIYMNVNGTRELIFGGVIGNLSSNPIKNGYKAQLFLNVECYGFSKLLERRNTFLYINNPITYKKVVENLIGMASDEGIKIGTIEGEEQVPSDFKFEGGTFAELLDNLADLIGYIWYVDQNRKLFFVKEYPKDKGFYSFVEKGIYQLGLSSRNDNNYYNKVIVQAENFNIVLEDEAEINKRKALMGSGVFGKILREKEIETPASAEKLAQNFLEQHSFNRQEFELVTNDFMDLNKEFDIKWQNNTYSVIATEMEIIQQGELPFFKYKLEYKPPTPKKLKYSFWKEEIKSIITTNSVNQKEVKTKQPKFLKISGENFELTKDDSEVLIMIECSFSVPKDGKGNVEIYIDGIFKGSITTGTVSATVTKTIQVDLKKGKHTLTGQIERLSSSDISNGMLPNRLNSLDYFVYSANLKTVNKSSRINLLEAKMNSGFSNGTSTISEIDGNYFEIY